MAKLLSGMIILALILVVGVTALAGGHLDREAAAQQRQQAEELHSVRIAALREQTAMDLERERALQPVKAAALGTALLGGGFLVAGAAWYLVAELRKRSHLVHADGHGIFPVIEVHVGQATALHDPNRSPVATTVYHAEGDRVIVMPVALPGLEAATEAAVRQAQAVQLTRAAVSGPGLVADAQDMARRFLEPRPRLPQVRVLEAPSPEVRALLAETGGEEVDDGDDGD